MLFAPLNCGVSIGDRVIINPVHHRHPQVVIGHNRDGIFRGLFCVDAVEAAEGGLLVACPPGCCAGAADLVLAEPLASVLYSLELLQRENGASPLLIRGCGTVGILAAKLWSRLTGRLAVLVSKSKAHAQWVRESTRWPANVRICSGTELENVIRECSEDDHLKSAILCCSREDAAEGLATLLDTVPDGGTIDLMAGFPTEFTEARLGGLTLDGIRWNNIRGITRSAPVAALDRTSGKTFYLLGHRGTSERHILQAIELLSRRYISVADVPHRMLTLGQLPEAVNKMLSRQTCLNTKWVKAIVTFADEDRGERNGVC